MATKSRYAVRGIKIKSNWFDPPVDSRKKSIFNRIGYKGFDIYLNLYKFYVANQGKEIFYTSIRLLREETGYRTSDIAECLKNMIMAGVIDIENVSRWEYLVNGQGKVDDNRLLIIIATDTPQTVRVEGKDIPVDEYNYYIYVHFYTLEKFYEMGLDIRHFSIYCLIQKWNHKNSIMFQSREIISSAMGYSINTISKLTTEMKNKNIIKVNNKKRSGKKYGERYEYEIVDGWTIEENDSEEKCDINENGFKIAKRGNVVSMPNIGELF